MIFTFRHSGVMITQFIGKINHFLKLDKSLVPYATHFVPYATQPLIDHSPTNVILVIVVININLVYDGKYIDPITNLKKYHP